MILSCIAITISFSSYYYSQKVSPLTYTLPTESIKTEYIANKKTPNVFYNIEQKNIEIIKDTGEISQIYFASVNNGTVEIQGCNYKDEHAIFSFENGLNILYYFDHNANIGFNWFDSANESCYKTNYFYVIIKSYSGDYYYNFISFYIDSDTKDNNDGTTTIIVNSKICKIEDLYNSQIINNLTEKINLEKYMDNKITSSTYRTNIEKDYFLIKEKLQQ